MGLSGTGGCGDSPQSFAQWESSWEKACGSSSLCSSSSPWAWKFTGHSLCGWLPFLSWTAGKLHQWQTRNWIYLLCHRSFCGKHRPTQNIQRGNMGEESCVLCCEDLSQASVENIQSPCCSQTIYHRKCIQVGLSLCWGPSLLAQFWAPWECSGNPSVCVCAGGLYAGLVPEESQPSLWSSLTCRTLFIRFRLNKIFRMARANELILERVK